MATHCLTHCLLRLHGGLSGFSLVELIAVLTISSLIAMAVTMNWTGSLSSASVTDSIEKIVESDRQTRRHALTHGKPCAVEFDLRKNLIKVSRWRDGREFFRTIQLNSKAKVTDVGPGGKDFQIDAYGSGPTYYVRVSNANDKQRWVLFAGGSGQHHLFKNENDVQEFMQALASAGVNTR